MIPERSRPRVHAPRGARGFTLIEMMITLVVLALVVIVLSTMVLTASRSKTSSVNGVESTQAARIALDMISTDLRSAGYGADVNYSGTPQRPIAYVDSLEIIINENLKPWPDTTAVPGGPLAYNPGAAPAPIHLAGTSWQPPARYTTGAECVRWTLDLNNDGSVDANDLNDPNGVDALRTRNPDDYVLARAVYGDSTGNVAGNNGGSIERVALVALPSGSNPPLFTVYLNGSADPWDWANGPVPASELPNITRVQVSVVGLSAKPDWQGKYARATFKSDISSLRNIPDFSSATFDVDGYVFNSLNGDVIRDAGEPGLSGVQVRCGVYSSTTDMSGYYYMKVPGGTYTLRSYPPPGFGVRTNPDSFVVTLGPDVQRSFADTAAAGGTVSCLAFEDQNANLAYNAGEPKVPNAKFQMSPTGQVVYSDTSGAGSLFAPVGNYSVTCTAPDSFVVMSANPVTGNMTNGGSTNARFALSSGAFGYLRGTVYRDNNRSGSMDGGEQGIPNVWVAVTPDGGATVQGFDYTDASGGFNIKAPSNDPPHTTALYLMCIAPTGFFPTSTTSIGPLWIQDGQIYNNNNFGMSSFQVIVLNASRVLSLASADVVEKDWPGASVALAHQDADIVLGADAAGTDQVSAWFNQYNVTPLFTTAPTYTRSAPQAVLAMALDTLDGSAPKTRPDMVTGTKLAASGNFFVWFNQNTSGNEGYFPATYSAGQAYKTLDNGDVQAVRTYDCAGGAGADYPDLIVGTKSPTAGLGTIEIWKSNNAATPTYTRDEIYPPAGGTAPGSLGEVTSMVLTDFDGDGKRDLAVGTTTGATSGQVVFFKFSQKSGNPHFLYMSTVTLPSDAVTSLTSVDVNGDGTKDVVVGTQHSLNSGKLIFLRNAVPALFSFVNAQTVDAPGIVSSLLTGDFGGLPGSDIAMGYRESTVSYLGGTRIYILDSRSLPPSGTDPSGGAVVNYVPALTANDFNFGANPSSSPPFLTDLAAGVKITATTGALVVFIR